MREVLGDAGVYFDPEDPADIAGALRELINSPLVRSSLAQAAFQRAQGYSWQRCARETLDFLARVVRTYSSQATAPERG
jgi:glycosyltransferase involved in cell wall biosynthesis